MPSTRDNTKRKRPKQAGTLVGVRLQPDDLAVVDGWRKRWRERTGTEISRPEALREMIRVVIRMGGLDEH